MTPEEQLKKAVPSASHILATFLMAGLWPGTELLFRHYIGDQIPAGEPAFGWQSACAQALYTGGFLGAGITLLFFRWQLRRALRSVEGQVADT